LAGAAATGVKIAPPDAAPGLIGYQDVHSSTSEAISNKKRRTGKEHALAGQDNRTPALATIERRQDRDRDVIPQEEEGNEHT